jgi:hypothetical protein
MAYIYYQLNNSSNLQGMAPPAAPGGGFGIAALPVGMAGTAGMYIIINCNGPLENRYVGISSDIGVRFNTRMATVTEMGIDAATLANIHVVWGTVKYRNHPAGGGAAAGWPACPLVGGGNVPFPAWGAGGWTAANPVAGGGPFARMIDGALINLEHLLIRFVMTQLGAGGTVSNNMLMVPFNAPPAWPGTNPIIVKFHSAPFGNYNGFTRAAVLAPGGAAW